MNAQLRSPDPLSLTLPPASPQSRRRRVGNLELDELAVIQFNHLLGTINAGAPRVDADQLVTLARSLQSQPSSQIIALLAERLARAESLRRMVSDRDWEISADLRERARMLLDYLRRIDDLIPDETPIFGHLDDALLVELTWQAFEGETHDYRDFCRFQVERRPRGSATERRIAWENSVLVEANDWLQRRRVSESHYASTDLHRSLFRVC